MESKSLFNLAMPIAVVLAAAITAIANIVSAKIKSASVSRDANQPTDGASDSRASATMRRWKSPLALFAISLAALNLAFMSFGPHASSALSAGDAASIAQSVCLLLTGFWLMARE